MKRVIFILMLLLLLLISCDDENKITSGSHPDPSILTNAQRMAVFYSEELFPPEDLTREIYNELQIIRTEYGDSNRGLSARFVGSWDFSSITITVDDTTYESILNGTNTLANELKDSLNLSYYHYFGHFIIVHSSYVLNSARLGEQFIGFPGVSHIGTSPTAWPQEVIYTRETKGNITDYFFRIICQWDVYFDYYRFRFINHQLVSMKHFSECPDESEIDLSDLTWEQIDSIYNSIYENTPDWVHESSSSLQLIYYGFHFSWYRDTL